MRAPFFYVLLLAVVFPLEWAEAQPTSVADRPGVVRQQLVSVNPRSLAAGEPVSLNLFGTELMAEPSATEIADDGSTVWIGHVHGRADSLVAFVTSGDRVTGHVALDGLSYEIRPLADGTHALEEVDISALPDELPPVEPVRRAPGHNVGPSRRPSVPPAGAQDEIDVVRVLAAYTPGAAAAVFDIRSAIRLAATLTNTAFVTSRIDTRIELAAIVPIDFGGGDLWMGSELAQLTSPDDGIADGIHARRDDLEADVVMVVSDSRGACGISNLLLDLSIDAEADAFSITHHSCMGTGYTFTHELGHTLGAGHDRDAGCVGLFPYSCGYKHEGGLDLWRTVMAYPCAGGTCPRILNFSNPLVSYLGDATGADGDEDVATDNASTITLAAPTVASFRGASIAPRDVEASEDLFDGVRVTWSAPELPAAAYRVQRFDRWNDREPSKSWSVGALSFFDDTAGSDGEHYYRVAAFTMDLVQGPASPLVRGFRPIATCGNGTIDEDRGEKCDGGFCCDDECAIRPEAICGRPVTGPLDATCSNAPPTALDCLRIFNAATGLETCEPACLCDVVAGSARGITPTDALLCLGAAVGEVVDLDCTCGETE